MYNKTETVHRFCRYVKYEQSASKGYMTFHTVRYLPGSGVMVRASDQLLHLYVTILGTIFTHLCASVIKQYNLVLVKK